MTDCRDVIEHYEYQVQCLEERIEKLEAANLRQSLIKLDDMRRIEKLEAALRSIAANTCCDSCREAALVARKALDAK